MLRRNSWATTSAMSAIPAAGGCKPSPFGRIGSRSPKARLQSRSRADCASITPRCSPAAASRTNRGRSCRTCAVQLSSRQMRICRL
eukprot:scaffold31018_cov63-Phaeocystis_antarctica.AAC.12